MTGQMAAAPTVTKPFCRTTGKFCYCNRKKALSAMNATRAHPHDDGPGPVAVYKCRFCGDWHMTSQEQRVA